MHQGLQSRGHASQSAWDDSGISLWTRLHPGARVAGMGLVGLKERRYSETSCPPTHRAGSRRIMLWGIFGKGRKSDQSGTIQPVG